MTEHPIFFLMRLPVTYAKKELPLLKLADNLQCNGLVEKLNGTLWKAIEVTLHSRNMKLSTWECVLPDALHSICSLLCTSTNMTPHDLLFSFPRKSTVGKSFPSWVKPGPVYIRNRKRASKFDPPVTPATLLHANPSYAHIQLPSGIETTVNVRDIAPQNLYGNVSPDVGLRDEIELAESSDNMPIDC